MLKQVQNCFTRDKVMYSWHAREEMETEEFGEIVEQEVCEALLEGREIEIYPEDSPYPSCLVYGRTSKGRPLHVLCAYSKEDEEAIVVTVYQPDPERWIDFQRRKT